MVGGQERLSCLPRAVLDDAEVNASMLATRPSVCRRTVEDRGMNGTTDRFGLGVSRDSWPPTGWLAIVGSTIFVSGFFLLAVAGREFDARVYALVLSGAVIITAPIYVLGLVVTFSESAVGRAWASGFRELRAGDRSFSGTAWRALRYAGFLWLANGVALWFATLAAQV
jgi:hypothetical protein